jgi:hypothetical protein
MQFILFTYGLSIAYLFISLMKYKHGEHLENKMIAAGKTPMALALIVKPIVFTCIAIGLNNFLGQQTGFWLVGIGHLVIGFYYLSNLYLYSKKQGSFLSEQT